MHDYEWTILKDADLEEEGLRQGVCRLCGETAQESIPVVIPEPTAEPEQAADDGSGSGLQGSAEGDGGAEDLDAAGDGANAGDVAAQEVSKNSKATLVVLITITCIAFGIIGVIHFRKK